MNTEKLIVKKKDINTLIENEIKNFGAKLERTMGDLGDDSARRIDYNDRKDDAEAGVRTEFKLKEPIPELLECLAKMEEARSILSKIAAAHKDDETKKRVYGHYEKNNKLALEMIKEFGIVH
jgi:hypothetical protein